MQKGARLLSFFVELLYFSYHVFDFLVYLQEVGIQDAFTGFYRREVVKLGNGVIGIVGFLFFISSMLKSVMQKNLLA